MLHQFPISRLRQVLPYPSVDANKYTRGVLVIIGGSPAYPGAACLATDAAYKMGAGYVEVFCSPEALRVLQVHNVEAVVRAWTGWTCAFSRLAVQKNGHPAACLIGPGFNPKDLENDYLVSDVLKNCVYPVIVDGGALSFLATEEGMQIAKDRSKLSRETILTPHFGEAQKLAEPLGADVKNDLADDESCAKFARALAKAYEATVVLKGPKTFIAPAKSSSNEVYLMQNGTAALAKAGTGDVLAGIIGALSAQGLCAVDAANIGASIHALAAKEASNELTAISVCAQDVVSYIPKAISSIICE